MGEAIAAAQPYNGELPSWCCSALELLAIADEASYGIGASPPPEKASFAWFYLKQHWQAMAKDLSEDAASRSARTTSVCMEVPSDIVTVQPKGRHPRVGCTMRSLSRNLALLPPTTEIKTRWMMVPDAKQTGKALNLLIVPFPYSVTGKCYRATYRDDRGWGMFEVNQNWLPEEPTEFATFIRTLITAAKNEVDNIDGIILPELALEQRFADAVAAEFASESGLEFFITGASCTSSGQSKNRVAGYLYSGGELATRWTQSKHHRWKLDSSQIRTYSLGHALSPEISWWEDIEVGDRELKLFQVRENASLAVLICEDLARLDPVQNVVRAIGPSLVVALLMDGAQLNTRWPGRYATVLAEDPGSSVLTITSLGMLRRGYHPTLRPSQSVALWRDATGESHNLELANDHHAILITLSSLVANKRTLDGRDSDKTVQFQLTGTRQIRSSEKFDWL